ncbi:hypothetical protein HRbin06_01037 [archaeon HR06]|nr:hypothetical protein HRbin06_01037 [archaeon HR06]
MDKRSIGKEAKEVKIGLTLPPNIIKSSNKPTEPAIKVTKVKAK